MTSYTINNIIDKEIFMQMCEEEVENYDMFYVIVNNDIEEEFESFDEAYSCAMDNNDNGMSSIHYGDDGNISINNTIIENAGKYLYRGSINGNVYIGCFYF